MTLRSRAAFCLTLLALCLGAWTTAFAQPAPTPIVVPVAQPTPTVTPVTPTAPVLAKPSNPLSLPQVSVAVGGGEGDWVGALRIMALLTLLTVAPAILLTMTSFTRIIIVFGFLRQAIGTQQSPPNQILVGLALFLTVFIMQPVWGSVFKDALEPYLDQEISQKVALERAEGPVREFMFKHTRQKDLSLFVAASGDDRPQDKEEVATWQLIPAFVLSELKTAFQMGFMVYVPFLVLDMVVASILMAMGMMMLPPILISLPFKIMLFVLVDGWNLMVGSLVQSFLMNQGEIITFFQEAVKLAMMLSLPALMLGLVVGLMVSIFQAVTQINEQTLALIPKIIAIVAALMIFGGWMLTQLADYTTSVLRQVGTL